MNFRFIVLILGILFITACNTSKKVLVTTPVDVEIEDRQLDTMVITAKRPINQKGPEDFKLPTYNPTYTLKNDLIHTKLELGFDWKKQQVFGKATLTLEPYFYPVNALTLDAKGFDIHSISFVDSGKNLLYKYDGNVLLIDLGQNIPSGQEYKILIDYTAKPSEGLQGGSAAITSDQGLFFINHDGSNPNKPMQIWTQGETEFNSRWFPTIDKPNERCTQEVYLTVDDQFKTLSNGLLVSSTKNPDGSRTDYWKMNQPHAPYLFMVAVGEFAIVKENWENIPLEYYVEPEYEPFAKVIFNHTPEMLSFFSEKLGLKYPWDKYAQIIVRDYVSGAMENTTGVVFGEFVQKTDRELIDDDNDYIVAHEMFHHWFGDYVTCESWANLTMNEGFANYSEYLWAEHKYGKDRADEHRYNELMGYLGSARQGGVHPLIHFGYSDKESMFDAHSYNKGGLVLHMLRNYVGDEAFFAALNKYLTSNALSAVEAHDLRLAFEEVTGEDLNWFFNQWFFSPGHPNLEINYDYDAVSKKALVTIEQKQDAEQHPAIFELPMAVDVYIGKRMPQRYNIVLNQRKQIFAFDASEKPALVNVDADKILLATVQDNKSDTEFAFQYYNAKHFLDRHEALEALKNSTDVSAKAVLISALKDPYWVLRTKALLALKADTPEILKTIANLAASDPHSRVRSIALGILGKTGDRAYIPIAKKAIDNEKSYPVISAALNALNLLDSNEAAAYARKLEKENNASILNAVGEIYGERGDIKNLPFFEKAWSSVDGYPAVSFFGNYMKLIQPSDKSVIQRSTLKLKDVATDMTNTEWRRFGATKAMNDLRNNFAAQADTESDEMKKSELESRAVSITEMIQEVKAKETNDQLKSIYNSF